MKMLPIQQIAHPGGQRDRPLGSGAGPHTDLYMNLDLAAQFSRLCFEICFEGFQGHDENKSCRFLIGSEEITSEKDVEHYNRFNAKSVLALTESNEKLLSHRQPHAPRSFWDYFGGLPSPVSLKGICERTVFASNSG